MGMPLIPALLSTAVVLYILQSTSVSGANAQLNKSEEVTDASAQTEIDMQTIQELLNMNYKPELEADLTERSGSAPPVCSMRDTSVPSTVVDADVDINLEPELLSWADDDAWSGQITPPFPEMRPLLARPAPISPPKVHRVPDSEMYVSVPPNLRQSSAQFTPISCPTLSAPMLTPVPPFAPRSAAAGASLRLERPPLVHHINPANHLKRETHAREEASPAPAESNPRQSHRFRPYQE
ncbi:MAG: hypothetical protein MHM6MM_008595 [Cercozoa sp. M6MM]